MKKTLFIFGFLFLNFLTFAQEKTAFEIYTGPSKAILPFEVIPTNFNISTSNPLSYHLGLSFITEIAPTWQLSTQVEFFKRHLGTFAFSSQADTIRITGYSTDVIPLIALGIRKNWLGFSHSYYFQPSLSLMKSPAFLDVYEPEPGDEFNGIPLGLVSASNLGLGIRLEGGVKRYLTGGNYLTLGLRYQQGLRLMDQMNAPIFYRGNLEHVLVAKSKGSYLGAYIGFGISGQKFKKSPSHSNKHIPDELNLQKEKAAGEDGVYFFMLGGIRLREQLLQNPYTYSNISGQFQLGIGYYFKDFSIETGYGNYSYNNNYQLDWDGQKAVFMTFEHFSAGGIPLTLKYHLPLDERKNWKIGPSFSGFLILSNTADSPYYYGGGQRTTTIGDQTYEATSSFEALSTNWRSMFSYRAGLFTERRFLNSSFLSLQFSRNFGSPVLSRLVVDYQIEGQNINQIHEGGLNGYSLELSLRFPIKVLMAVN
ncbi:MAG TPA: hypothetical protein DEQ87_02245 [Algoriphagus sp.]|jgi:hypothetical protein|uniref:hypothetical protein n=3 Tax=Algoriphagus TaxID=246875 RepID=UPI000C5E08A0|nr:MULTISPECIES: hypothetical protein [unclassified Algoriphagus]MAL12785.1 hypothetical protein [Algoriphagus sp.]MAN88966.1 hypothetical protein [Algoriphagus sp.]QYH39586.1 hypothetical protein GYM62_12640 [Algoriphagus sp. NBT04N3]HAD52733.1 hypothetical protein [Algoriphagus sp.]HAH35868.1 hypothetical protein [Algoriphagus sp.]